MPIPLGLSRAAASRLLQGAVHPFEPLANELRHMVLASRARRAQRQAAEEALHLNPAILADIGIEPVLAAARLDRPVLREQAETLPETAT